MMPASLSLAYIYMFVLQQHACMYVPSTNTVLETDISRCRATVGCGEMKGRKGGGGCNDNGHDPNQHAVLPPSRHGLGTLETTGWEHRRRPLGRRE